MLHINMRNPYRDEYLSMIRVTVLLALPLLQSHC